MAYEPNNPALVPARRTGVAGAETVPPIGRSGGREMTSRLLPPLLAVASVISIWWALYTIYPRLLPSPFSTVQEAMRLLSDGTFFFHMYQSLRRVFVGSLVAMFFSVGIGIYMGTVVMGERFFQPLMAEDRGMGKARERGLIARHLFRLPPKRAPNRIIGDQIFARGPDIPFFAHRPHSRPARVKAK